MVVSTLVVERAEKTKSLSERTAQATGTLAVLLCFVYYIQKVQEQPKSGRYRAVFVFFLGIYSTRKHLVDI